MSANRQRSGKRWREQSACAKDNTNEPTEVENRFLKAPKRGVQQARQLLLFDDHIDVLYIQYILVLYTYDILYIFLKPTK